MEKSALISIQGKSARYFSGNVSITNFKSLISPFINVQEPINLLQKNRQISVVSPRTVYQRSDAKVLFGGEFFSLRKIIGLDSIIEIQTLDSLSLREPREKNRLKYRKSILISSAIEKKMKVSIGDEVTVLLTTDSGNFNTDNFIVTGIFEESSLFAYAAYLRRDDLNELLDRNIDSATDIAVFAKPAVDIEKLSREIHFELSKSYPTYPLFSSLKERDEAIFSSANDGSDKFVVLSQNAQLAQIKQVLDAMSLAVGFVMALFIAIVMVGVLNTYRVMVYSRRKEIGTMRALGMQRSGVRWMFIREALALSFVSCLAGTALSILICYGISFFDLSNIPAAGLFLERGRLMPRIDPTIFLFGYMIISAAVISAVIGPANNSAKIAPVDAMRDVR